MRRVAALVSMLAAGVSGQALECVQNQGEGRVALSDDACVPVRVARHVCVNQPHTEL